MATQLPDPDIEKLLAELRSDDANRRQAALGTIAERKLRNDEIIDITQELAKTDPDEMVRNQASQALMAIGAAEQLPVSGARVGSQPVRQWSRNEIIRDLLVGFVGWYAANGLVWVVISGGTIGSGEFAGFVNLLVLPINVLVLIIAVFVRPWFALGLLASYGVNLAVALLLGATINGVCWIPFFVK